MSDGEWFESGQVALCVYAAYRWGGGAELS